MSYSYDPLRRALVVADARLTKLMQREPETCAALSEYAARTGTTSSIRNRMLIKVSRRRRVVGLS